MSKERITIRDSRPLHNKNTFTVHERLKIKKQNNTFRRCIGLLITDSV